MKGSKERVLRKVRQSERVDWGGVRLEREGLM